MVKHSLSMHCNKWKIIDKTFSLLCIMIHYGAMLTTVPCCFTLHAIQCRSATMNTACSTYSTVAWVLSCLCRELQIATPWSVCIEYIRTCMLWKPGFLRCSLFYDSDTGVVMTAQYVFDLKKKKPRAYRRSVVLRSWAALSFIKFTFVKKIIA